MFIQLHQSYLRSFFLLISPYYFSNKSLQFYLFQNIFLFFTYKLMADLFLRKTLNARLGPDFVKHELWFLCRSAFVNRITIFDYDFRSIHGAYDPNYYVSPGYVGSIVVEP